MAPPGKAAKYTRWNVISTCLRFFACTHPHRMLYVAVIIGLSLGRNFIYGMEYFERSKLIEDRNDFYRHLLYMLFLKIVFHGMHFVKYYLFETYLAKYGAMVAAVAMRRILASESPEVVETPGGQIEYYVTEGSKEMAKITRQMIIDTLSKVVYLIIDHVFIFYMDRTEGKIIFYTALAGSVLITLFKFYCVWNSVPHHRRTIELSYERERIYTELVDNLTIVKAYGMESEVLQRYKERTTRWQEANLMYRFLLHFGTMAYESLGTIFRMALTIGYVSNHSGKSMHVGDVRLVLTITQQLLATGVALVKVHRLFEESYALTDRIMQYLSLANDEAKRLPVSEMRESFEMRDVTYAARGKVIFSGASLTLRRGDKAALYGRNGVGKSSVFRVLMGFDAFRGAVLLDGIDAARLRTRDVRALITYVPQDTRLFDDTIYANLVFGHARPYDAVVAECRRLGIHERIMLLPHGYNTQVGEGGRNLNGGLRQLIFYARALLRDTPLYLFDEPTNNLDARAAGFLAERLADPAYAEKTFLVVCHDMAVVDQFPKVYRFDEGEIVLERDNNAAEPVTATA